MNRPDLMYDGQQWWTPCPLRRFWWHSDIVDVTANGNHAYGFDGRCWLLALPEDFRHW